MDRSSGSLIGGDAAGQSGIKKPAGVADHIKSLESQVDGYQEVVHRLRSIADRLTGGRPESVMGGAGRNIASEQPILTRLENAASTMNDFGSAINEQISRIERAL